MTGAAGARRQSPRPFGHDRLWLAAVKCRDRGRGHLSVEGDVMLTGDPSASFWGRQEARLARGWRRTARRRPDGQTAGEEPWGKRRRCRRGPHSGQLLRRRLSASGSQIGRGGSGLEAAERTEIAIWRRGHGGVLCQRRSTGGADAGRRHPRKKSLAWLGRACNPGRTEGGETCLLRLVELRLLKGPQYIKGRVRRARSGTSRTTDSKPSFHLLHVRQLVACAERYPRVTKSRPPT